MPAPKGRVWVGLWLLFVLATLGWVVARQTSAHAMAAELADLRQRRAVLEGERAELLRRIRQAESRAVLVPRARALGLRLPADSEIVILPGVAPERR